MAEHEHSAPGGVWSAFETEAMPHVDWLFRLAMWWERDRGAAEDLVQDTLVQALKSFHRFTPGTNCRAWLATILRHVRSNKRRAQFREPLVDDPNDRIAETVPFVPAVPERITDEDMLMALREYPSSIRTSSCCVTWKNSYKDIAQALGIPMGTVMSRLHRGRGPLRQALAAQHSASSDHGRSRDVSSEGVG